MDYVFRPKFFSLLKRGKLGKTLQKDILAGIIVGIVALPLAIAFAVASGVSPERGLVTAVIAGFIISLIGGSRVQIGGPTGAFIVIVFGVLSQYGWNGLVISTIMAGIMLVLFGLFRLGAVLKYIPHPLIVGFTSGIALIIFSTQMKDAFGFSVEGLPSEFIPKWIAYFQHLDKINIYAIAITVATILITIFSQRFFKKIPGSFISIILITAIVSFSGIPVNTIGSIFGEIKGTISFEMPTVEFENLKMYIQPAFTIAMLGAIESLLSAVVADGMISSRHHSNTELIAQGAANIITPFFGGIPATGAIARTATNIKNGGRTPVAGIIHAITLLLIMFFLGSWAKLIPMSCLAGILIVVAYNMSEWKTFASILRGSRYDILILLTAFFLTVLVDLTVAIEVGVILSAFIFMQRMSKLSNVIPLEESGEIDYVPVEIPKGIEVFEINGPFFFAAAGKYQETIQGFHDHNKVIIIRMRHVPFIDATGVHNFKEVIRHILSKKKKVILSGVNKEVREELHIGRIEFMIGKAHIFDNFDKALIHAKELLKENKD